jgi:hypothetical protein
MHTKITFNVGIFFLVVGSLLVILSVVSETYPNATWSKEFKIILYPVFADTNIVGYGALLFGMLLVAVSSLLAD